MKGFRAVLFSFFVLLIVSAFPAHAQTPMLTAAGVTTPTNSTCPVDAGANVCLNGWFSIDGADDVIVHAWETTGSGTAIVYLDQAFTSSGADSWVLKQWTNPASSEIALVFVSGRIGWVRIRATAVGASGVVKATLRAVREVGSGW